MRQRFQSRAYEVLLAWTTALKLHHNGIVCSITAVTAHIPFLVGIGQNLLLSMEIPRQQFSQKLPTIQKAIEECDFIAVDTELSGLHRPGNSRRVDTLANRYAEYREASQRFIIIQFGFCTFKWDEPSGRYMAKPFNFYVFPTGMTGRVQPNRVFHTQAQAFDFLSKQSFDFNKWVYQGVPYLTRQEEQEYVADAKKRLADELPDIPIDEKELPFIRAAREKIDAWVADPNPEDAEGVNITTRNAYQRRLIYQEVRNRYETLTADGRQGFIRVLRLNEKQLKQRAKERQKQFESLVGTATSLDVLRFETTREAFKNPQIDMDWEFPRYLTEKAHEAGWDAYMTGAVFLKLVSYLENQRNPVPQQKEEEVIIEPPKEEEREKPTTDDGWDVEDQEEEDENSNWVRPDEEEVYNYGSTRVPLMDETNQLTPLLDTFVNKVTMVRTGFEYFDFINTEAVTEQSNAFHVYGSAPIVLQTIVQLFTPFGRHVFDAIDDTSGFIIYENLREEPAEVKRSIAAQLASMETTADGLVVETVSEYLQRRKNL
ncbi:hypothetical protein DFQ28_005888 [Apophysomyces sp. BC1034]|nr:hypothetical protein DFQ28_005888 [Apophysomyces sp. BC1034]